MKFCFSASQMLLFLSGLKKTNVPRNEIEVAENETPEKLQNNFRFPSKTRNVDKSVTPNTRYRKTFIFDFKTKNCNFVGWFFFKKLLTSGKMSNFSRNTTIIKILLQFSKTGLGFLNGTLEISEEKSLTISKRFKAGRFPWINSRFRWDCFRGLELNFSVSTPSSCYRLAKKPDINNLKTEWETGIRYCFNMERHSTFNPYVKPRTVLSIQRILSFNCQFFQLLLSMWF